MAEAQKRVKAEVKLPEVAPRATVRIPLTVQFPGAGNHDLSFQIPEDGLPRFPEGRPH